MGAILIVTIVKNVEIYSPDNIGKKDVVILFNKIEGIYDEFKYGNCFTEYEIIDGTGLIMFPGLIDSHVHISGGGGESGFKSRTPEINFFDLISGGSICINMNNLLSKEKGLEEEGIN